MSPPKVRRRTDTSRQANDVTQIAPVFHDSVANTTKTQRVKAGIPLSSIIRCLRRYLEQYTNPIPTIMPLAETRISRLLLCSSDHHKLDPLRLRLNATGIEVDCTTRAEDARELLWDQHYDGVAIDLLLADRDGISFAMELRQEHPWVSMLVISTTAGAMHSDSAPDWLNRTTDYARLVFALKQAGQRSATGRAPSILHVEDDDRLAELVQNTIGRQTSLFRARSAQEAQIAMALRTYDLALLRTPLPALTKQWCGHRAAGQQTLCVNTDNSTDPLITILNNLRRSAFVHEPAYC
jgi:DNA-binding response OmpR family regulator